jgi:hypothetical protein
VNAAIFLGPTVTVAEARARFDASFFPPAAQGDIYRVCQQRPAAIGIVDGYFEAVPAVWHKEILHAMAEGIHVFGAASMGALRAVELERFGMIGVGAVFEAFRDGALEDDDEVALRHGPPEDGYRPLSVPMVNVRATIAAATTDGVVGVECARALVDAVKGLPYERRSYRAAIAAVAGRGFEAELRAFSEWWPRSQIDQKRLDALAMMSEMATFLATSPAPKVVDFRVEETEAWREARERVRRVDAHFGGAANPEVLVLEELRLTGAYRVVRERALTRALILDHARARRDDPDRDEVQDAVRRFRGENGVVADAAFSEWRRCQGLDEDDAFDAFFARQAEVYRAEVFLRSETDESLMDQLRAEGTYGHLLERATAKRAALGTSADVEGLESGLAEGDLWGWYFREVAQEERPRDVAKWALASGFEDVRTFRLAVTREWLFRRRDGSPRNRAEEQP